MVPANPRPRATSAMAFIRSARPHRRRTRGGAALVALASGFTALNLDEPWLHPMMLSPLEALLRLGLAGGSFAA